MSNYLRRRKGLLVNRKRVRRLMRPPGLTVPFKRYKGEALGDPGQAQAHPSERVVWPDEFSSFEEAPTAVDAFLHFYNEDYPHSSLNGMSPVDFERSLKQTAAQAA